MANKKKKMECLDSLYEQIGMEALQGSIIWYGSPETETRIYFEEKLDTNQIVVSWYTALILFLHASVHVTLKMKGFGSFAVDSCHG